MDPFPIYNNPIKTFNIYSEIVLKSINEIKKFAIDNKLLDTQEFLDFMDELNKLSLDPDRI